MNIIETLTPEAARYYRYLKTHKAFRLLFGLVYIAAFIIPTVLVFHNRTLIEYGYLFILVLAILAGMDVYRIINLYFRLRIVSLMRQTQPDFQFVYTDFFPEDRHGKVDLFLLKAGSMLEFTVAGYFAVVMLKVLLGIVLPGLVDLILALGIGFALCFFVFWKRIDRYQNDADAMGALDALQLIAASAIVLLSIFLLILKL